ncbi:phenylacetate--CoA ligase family protein [Ferroglobus sp.]|uniref:phenylacetate--CoA ligase family protein n=1 Tax=Ferroglobus sp. TaxID=2614230 RepID=UPI0025BFCEB5|nr:phenylacetate--CoA ligase [Ferroglobus sp.]
MYWNPVVEKMSKSELKELQERKLRQTVEFAYRYSEFYRKLYDQAGVKPDDIKSLEDLEKLPFVKKQDLRDNYPYGMFAVPLKDVVRIHASSGTTGKPTVTGYTYSDLELWTESLARGLYAAGVRKEDIVQNAYGYGLFTGGLGFHYAAEKIGATVIPASSGNTQRQIELMRDLGTTVICCTPSYMIYLAEYAEKMGVSLQNDTKLRMGFFGAEPWSEETRKRIEEKTGIDAINVYGTSEISGPVVTECHEKAGIHFWSDIFIIEVIDPETGERLGEGEKGELVVTVLGKEALPMIRWRTGDITAIIEEKCNCGRWHPRIERIVGRADDMFIVRGVNVFPSQVEYALMQVKEVSEHYQIVLERDEAGLDVMTVLVEINPEYKDKVSYEAVQKKVTETLKSYLNVTPKVEVVEPETLPRFEGKAKRVIDKRKV